MTFVVPDPDRFLCHAAQCPTPIHRGKFMCDWHWNLVPVAVRDRMAQCYQPGQDHDVVRPSGEWFAAAREAIAHVRELEHHQRITGRRRP